jgi:hypothetical protein
MIRVVHPGSRIPDPDADFLPCRIPDPGVKKIPDPGSRIRIRNTDQSPPPPAPEYPIRTVSNFIENSRRYSQVKVQHRYQRHRWQILPPVSLVLLILVANF